MLCSTVSHVSEPFVDFLKYVEKQGFSIEVPEVEDCFNAGSAIVEIGDTSFCYTSDAFKATEQSLLDSG